MWGMVWDWTRRVWSIKRELTLNLIDKNQDNYKGKASVPLLSRLWVIYCSRLNAILSGREYKNTIFFEAFFGHKKMKLNDKELKEDN